MLAAVSRALKRKGSRRDFSQSKAVFTAERIAADRFALKGRLLVCTRISKERRIPVYDAFMTHFRTPS